MKKILLTLTIASTGLTAGCKDQINSPQTSGSEKVVYTTMTMGKKPIALVSADADGSNRTVIADPGSLLCVGGGKILWMTNTLAYFNLSNNVGGETVRITPTLPAGETFYADYTTALSPDGKKIAFVSRNIAEDKNRLYIINSDGSGQILITDEYDNGTTPCFSPDGTKIAYYTGDLFSGGTLQTSSVSGGSKSTLTSIVRSGADGAGMISWSKLGKLCYSDNYNLYIIGEDGTGKNIVAAGAAAGSWSPDGTKLAYCGDPSNPTDPTFFDIYITEDGGLLNTNVSLTTGDTCEVMPKWSSDGNKLVVTHWIGEYDKVTTGTEIIDLTTLKKQEIDPLGGFGYFVK